MATGGPNGSRPHGQMPDGRDPPLTDAGQVTAGQIASGPINRGPIVRKLHDLLLDFRSAASKVHWPVGAAPRAMAWVRKQLALVMAWGQPGALITVPPALPMARGPSTVPSAGGTTGARVGLQ